MQLFVSKDRVTVDLLPVRGKMGRLNRLIDLSRLVFRMNHQYTMYVVSV